MPVTGSPERSGLWGGIRGDGRGRRLRVHTVRGEDDEEDEGGEGGEGRGGGHILAAGVAGKGKWRKDGPGQGGCFS